MTRRSRLILALTIVLAGIAAFICLIESDLLNPETEASPGDHPVQTEAAGPGTEREPKPEKQGIDTEPFQESTGHGWIVRGRTFRGRQNSYPQVRLRVRVFKGVKPGGDPVFEEVITSDDAARFSIALPTLEEPGTLSFKGVMKQHWSFEKKIVVLPGEGPPQDVRVTTYPMDLDVDGIVKDTNGQPVPGATVLVRPNKATTDEAGRFRISLCSDVGLTSIYGYAPGFSVARHKLSIKDAAEGHLVEVILSKGASVGGIVKDELGTPIEGVHVTGNGFLMEELVSETDSSGRYTLDYMRRESDFQSVSARKEGYVAASVRFDASESGARVDITLSRGARVSGLVLNPEGKPLHGASVYIGFDPAAWNRLDESTDQDGRFTFEAVPFGKTQMVTQYKGYAADTRALTVAQDRRIINDIIVSLSSGLSVRGQVKDDEGTTVKGLAISVRHMGKYLDGRWRTDDNGRFRLDGLPREDVELELYGEGIIRKREAVDSADCSNMLITVQGAGLVAGMVSSEVTGQPVREFWVRFVKPVLEPGEEQDYIHGATFSGKGKRFKSDDGYFDTGEYRLTPGKVIGLEVRAADHAPTVVPHVVVERKAPARALLITMRAGARIEGVVESSAGPVEGAEVQVLEDVRRRSEPRTGDDSNPYVAKSGPDGSFLIKNVRAMRAWLVVTHAGHPRLIDGPVMVPGSGVVRPTLVMASAGHIVGTVEDAEGRSQAGRKLHLWSRDTGRDLPYWLQKAHVTVTDDQGRFAFRTLRPGTYRLGLWLDGVSSRTDESLMIVQVEAGRTLKLRFRPPGSCTIRGTVSGPSGMSRGLVVRIGRVGSNRSPPSGVVPAAAVVREGRFQISGVRAGTYTVSVWWGDNENDATYSARAQVDLQEGSTAEVQLVLSPQK